MGAVVNCLRMTLFSHPVWRVSFLTILIQILKKELSAGECKELKFEMW